MSASFSPSFSATTIESVLTRLFPNGTRGTPDRPTEIHEFPLIPSDLFAAAAYLLERGDAYRRIAPDGSRTSSAGTAGYALTSEERLSCKAIGDGWAAVFLAGDTSRYYPAAIQAYWDVIIRHRNLPLLTAGPDSGPGREFWRAVLALLIIADRAFDDLGFKEVHYNWFYRFSGYATYGDPDETNPAIDSTAAINGDVKHVRYCNLADTVCILVDPYVIRVLPKSRTPAVGCTMRALTENLALLPPRGSVNMHWFHPVKELDRYGNALNLLAIPFPYRIAASDFEPRSRDSSRQHDDWDWFGVAQNWLPSDTGAVAQFVLALIKQAERDCGAVHGIVFPEYALNWQTYAELVRQIRFNAPDVEFIVAGSSSDCSGAEGNFVLTTTFEKNQQERKALTYARAKHHRWRLDKNQINEYGLASALDPHKLWWEDMAISAREVGLTTFRKKSIFSALICEDLARSEPCHSAVRSVGPNLVFVLLMDGPQIASRWSARYATSLADDPGSAVLTLTSRGLIERVNAMGRRTPNNAVALWKDDVNSVSSLDLPRGAAALLLTLSGENTREATLDGRTTAEAAAWRYHNHVPVFPGPGHANYGMIVGSI